MDSLEQFAGMTREQLTREIEKLEEDADTARKIGNHSLKGILQRMAGRLMELRGPRPRTA